jgi:hypothetical protein
LRLLEALINSIRGITEIEQTERDRALQNTLSIVGVGLATGSIVSIVSNQFPQATNPTEASQNPVGYALYQVGIPTPWLTPTISLIASISAAYITAMLTGIVIRLRQRLR